MNPIDFPERNCTYTGENCLPLPVCRQHSEEFNTIECISCLEFTDDEIVTMLKQIKAGKRPAIFLSIIGGQPPVALWLKE